MAGWLSLLLLIVGVGAYCVYEDSQLPPPEVREAAAAKSMADNMGTMCVKGVLYYYTSGAHSARMAPAIDNVTMQFIRCK
ncbi:hypothetical protein D3C75_1152410 [compost metagenome]